MKASPFLEEILFLVAQFLHKAKHEDIATQLQKHIDLPAWVQHNNPLIKKGLAKIVKEYVKTQPSIQNYYANRHPQSQEEEDEVIVPQRKRSSDRLRKEKSPQIPKEAEKHASKVKNSPKVHTQTTSPKNQASSWMSKFQKPKRLEDIQISQKVGNHNHVEQPKETKVKVSKKEKKEKIQSSEYESQEDSFQLEPKKKTKKQAKVQKVQTKQKQKATLVETNTAKQEQKPAPKVIPQRRPQQPYNNQGPKKFFSRINVNDLQPIKNELQDNSFGAKAKFGQAADEWGKFGYEKLKDTRGESFKKTKGKLKNRAFQGNLMDVNLINSIPIL